MADWKPRWYLPAVPTEAFVGSAGSVFNLAVLGEKRACSVPARMTNPDHLIPRGPSLTNVPLADSRPVRGLGLSMADGRPGARTRTGNAQITEHPKTAHHSTTLSAETS
jgi:hypothetical protein